MAGLPGNFWINDFGLPTIPTGFDATNWDQMFLGPIPKAWPGLVKVEASVTLDVTVQRQVTDATKSLPPGQQIKEVFLVDNGYNPAKVRATVAVWNRLQWIELQIHMATIAPDVTSSFRPCYVIHHPAAALLGISQVIVEGFTVHPPEEQTLFVEIEMMQWYPFLASKPQLDGGAAAAVQATVPAPKP